MAEGTSNGNKKTSYSCCGCLTLIGVIAIIIGSIIAYPSVKEAINRDKIEHAVEIAKQIPPSQSLSQEDTTIVLVWTYLPIKLGLYTDEFNASDEGSDARDRAIQKMTTLIQIERSLPTKPKYKDLTDSITTLRHKRIDSFLKGTNLEPIDDATQAAVLKSMTNHAADIRYVTDLVPKEEQNRILDRYYGYR